MANALPGSLNHTTVLNPVVAVTVADSATSRSGGVKMFQSGGTHEIIIIY